MPEAEELIVEFAAGVTEDEARQIASGVGGTVRRRMRTDSPEQVMLLLRLDADQLGTAKAKLDRHARVARTEHNAKSFKAL